MLIIYYNLFSSNQSAAVRTRIERFVPLTLYPTGVLYTPVCDGLEMDSVYPVSPHRPTKATNMSSVNKRTNLQLFPTSSLS